METVFVKLLNLSVQAGLLTLAVALVRMLTAKTRLPKSALVLMWGLVGLRLVCPFSVESGMSLLPFREVVRLESTAQGAVPALETGIPALDEALGGASVPSRRDPPSTGSVSPAPPETSWTTVAPEPEKKADALGTALYWASRVWPVGTACMLLYFFTSSLLLRRRVAGAEETEEGVWESERVPSPFVFGLLRPRVYLPWGLREEHREYVLAHERAHIKRRDHLIKPLAFLVLAVYWFNPLLWLAYVLLTRDIELACDERVLKELGPRAKRPYSEALLAAVTFHRYVAACPVAFGEGKLRGRVKNVLRWKKPAVWLTAASVLLCVVLGACFLTSPARGEKVPDPSEIPVSELAGSYKFAGDFPDGYGSNIFTVRLYEDHTFQYYETIYSSHIGMGTWAYSDGVVTLTEKRQHLVGGTVVEFSEGVLQNVGGTMEDYEAHIRFRVTQEGLIYLAEGSDNFYYVDVRDGDPFLREAEVPSATDGEREPAGISWSFKDGVLTVSGFGPMEDYERDTLDVSPYVAYVNDTISSPWYAFRNDIQRVVIGEGITRIGVYAFFGCENLQEISLPSTLKSVGYGAFWGSGLERVDFPAGVTELGGSMFWRCYDLKAVTIPEGVTEIPDFAFYDSGVSEISFPSTLKRIGDNAFHFCPLKNVELPEGLEEIAPWAFMGTGLTGRLDIPSTVRVIGDDAFSNCESLTSVTLPNGLEHIGIAAFSRSGLTEINIPDSVTEIGIYAFENCRGLTEIAIPGSVKSLGDGVFEYCASLRTVTLSPGLEEIGEGAFSATGSLESLFIPDGVTRIGQKAFEYTGAKTIRIPESVTEIGDGAFQSLEGVRVQFGGTAEEWAALTSDLYIPAEVQVTFEK